MRSGDQMILNRVNPPGPQYRRIVLLVNVANLATLYLDQEIV